MKTLFPVLIALLAGCVSPEQAARNREAQLQQQHYQQEAYRESVRSQCESMGFTRGTDAFANCVLQTHNQNMGNAATLGAAALQNQYQSLPYCGSVVNPFVRGQMRARGQCR
jgi:hypothetical protein